jgi:hypothetical protein
MIAEKSMRSDGVFRVLAALTVGAFAALAVEEKLEEPAKSSAPRSAGIPITATIRLMCPSYCFV